MKLVNTVRFVFPDFWKALAYKETQLAEYKKYYPLTKAFIGIMDRGRYSVDFKILA